MKNDSIACGVAFVVRCRRGDVNTELRPSQIDQDTWNFQVPLPLFGSDGGIVASTVSLNVKVLARANIFEGVTGPLMSEIKASQATETTHGIPGPRSLEGSCWVLKGGTH